MHAEVAKGWAVYDDRVDVFSLGIVAFELWHPFSTGMERVAMLKDLQEHGALPAEWAAANPKVLPPHLKALPCVSRVRDSTRSVHPGASQTHLTAAIASGPWPCTGMIPAAAACKAGVQVAELIAWLTAANPRHRPSMREVLRNELLPPTVGDEQLTDLLRSLPDKCGASPLPPSACPEP